MTLYRLSINISGNNISHESFNFLENYCHIVSKNIVEYDESLGNHNKCYISLFHPDIYIIDVFGKQEDWLINIIKKYFKEILKLEIYDCYIQYDIFSDNDNISMGFDDKLLKLLGKYKISLLVDSVFTNNKYLNNLLNRKFI
jgi:hypothetical protein